MTQPTSQPQDLDAVVQRRAPHAAKLNKLWETYHSKTVYVHCLERAFPKSDYDFEPLLDHGMIKPSNASRVHEAVEQARMMNLKDEIIGPSVAQAESEELARLKEMEIFEEVPKESVPKTALIYGATYVHAADHSNNDSPTAISGSSKIQARCVVQHVAPIKKNASSFSPMVLPESVRALLMAATSRRMVVNQMDVGMAYFYQPLDSPVYVYPPKGVAGVDDTKVWKCNKALYGLRNSDLSCYNTMKAKLESYGFKRLGSDQGIFSKTSLWGHDMYAALYLDDLLVGFDDMEDDYFKFLNFMRNTAKVPVKDLQEAKEFCGVEIEEFEGTYDLHQQSFIEQLSNEHKNFVNPQPSHARIPTKKNENKPLEAAEKQVFTEILGAFEWLTGISRPDFAHDLAMLQLEASRPKHVHLHQLRQMFERLLDTKEFTLVINMGHFPRGKITLHDLVDYIWEKDGQGTVRPGYLIHTNQRSEILNTRTNTSGNFALGEFVPGLGASETVFGALCSQREDLQWTKEFFRELGVEAIHIRNKMADIRILKNQTSAPKEKYEYHDVDSDSDSDSDFGDFFGFSEEKTQINMPYASKGYQLPYYGFDNRYLVRELEVMGW